MNVKQLGRVLFAVGLGGLGVLSLIHRDFAMNWQPVPEWVPLRAYLACASGTILLLGGMGTLLRRTAVPSALVLTIFVLTWLLLLQVSRVVARPTDEGAWLGFGENAVLVTGGWIVFLALAKQAGWPNIPFVAGTAGLRTGQLLFAVSLPLIGLSHFVYVDGTASMVPAWLPFHTGLAYLTGAGHIAAGVGLLFSIIPRMAATLEAAMMSSFVLLLHIPGVAAAPTDRLQWTMVFVALALTGAGWAVAGSFQDSP
jgi:uncharacterized membrane protein